MGRRLKKVLRVEFREKDEWLYDEITKLVTVKKEMGLNTSLNFEVARLLKRGLLSEGGMK